MVLPGDIVLELNQGRLSLPRGRNLHLSGGQKLRCPPESGQNLDVDMRSINRAKHTSINAPDESARQTWGC